MALTFIEPSSVPQNHQPDMIRIEPGILYYGTPVALITTLNADGTPNISPMSSSFALGDRVVLGMAETGQGLNNLRRTGECVINLPSQALWPAVEKLAPTTGNPLVPEYKRSLGYRHVPDKFGCAGLTPLPSQCVRPPRIAECPLQLEARLVIAHQARTEDAREPGGADACPPRHRNRGYAAYRHRALAAAAVCVPALLRHRPVSWTHLQGGVLKPDGAQKTAPGASRTGRGLPALGVVRNAQAPAVVAHRVPG